MGVVQLPAGDGYWSVNPILAHPWFRSVFSRHRFRQMLSPNGVCNFMILILSCQWTKV